MRKCKVFVNGVEAGLLKEELNPRQYTFQYLQEYVERALPPVSLSLPLRYGEYRSNVLFPYFFNILSEGENRALQAALLGIDKDDDFGILLATARYDTPGTVTVSPIPA